MRRARVLDEIVAGCAHKPNDAYNWMIEAMEYRPAKTTGALLIMEVAQRDFANNRHQSPWQ